jgi:hypothetical protein
MAAQGDLETAQATLKAAQDRIDLNYRLQMDYATSQYNYKTNLINKAYEFADKEQKVKLEQKQKEEDRKWEREKLDIQQQNAIELKNLENTLKGTGGTSVATTAEQAQLGTINDINNIIDNPAFISTFGVANTIKRNWPGSPEFTLKSNITNLIDTLAVAARGQLRGQGSVSDFEGKMLKNAQTALKFNMKPEDALQELVNVRGAIATSSGLTATVEIKDLKTGESQLVTADQAGINQAIKDGLKVTYK